MRCKWVSHDDADESQLRPNWISDKRVPGATRTALATQLSKRSESDAEPGSSRSRRNSCCSEILRPPWSAVEIDCRSLGAALLLLVCCSAARLRSLSCCRLGHDPRGDEVVQSVLQQLRQVSDGGHKTQDSANGSRCSRMPLCCSLFARLLSLFTASPLSLLLSPSPRLASLLSSSLHVVVQE